MRIQQCGKAQPKSLEHKQKMGRHDRFTHRVQLPGPVVRHQDPVHARAARHLGVLRCEHPFHHDLHQAAVIAHPRQVLPVEGLVDQRRHVLGQAPRLSGACCVAAAHRWAVMGTEEKARREKEKKVEKTSTVETALNPNFRTVMTCSVIIEYTNQYLRVIEAKIFKLCLIFHAIAKLRARALTFEVAHGQVAGQFELVSQVGFASAQHWGVHRHRQGRVAGTLGALDQVQRDCTVLKHARRF